MRRSAASDQTAAAGHRTRRSAGAGRARLPTPGHAVMLVSHELRPHPATRQPARCCCWATTAGVPVAELSAELLSACLGHRCWRSSAMAPLLAAGRRRRNADQITHQNYPRFQASSPCFFAGDAPMTAAATLRKGRPRRTPPRRMASKTPVIDDTSPGRKGQAGVLLVTRQWRAKLSSAAGMVARARWAMNGHCPGSSGAIAAGEVITAVWTRVQFSS